MHESHEDWLKRLDDESRAKQEAFMNGIAAKLGRSRATAAPDHPYRGAPSFWKEFELSTEERIRMFTANFQAAGGHVVRFGDAAEAQAFIAEKARETGAKRILRHNRPELARLLPDEALPHAEVQAWNAAPHEDWKARAAEADIGVIAADYAVAYTGSIVAMSAPDKGRSVSLLPTMLVAVIPAERLRTRLGEVMTELDRAGRERLPAGIHFISGPSRSADIENDLTIGVHGPGIVYAVIVDRLD